MMNVISVGSVSVDSNHVMSFEEEDLRMRRAEVLVHLIKCWDVSIGWWHRGQKGAFHAPLLSIFLPIGRNPITCLDRYTLCMGERREVAPSNESQSMVENMAGWRLNFWHMIGFALCL